MTMNQMYNIDAEIDAQQTVDLEFLERMDFKEIEGMDPSCKNGWQAVFKQTIPCAIQLDYNTSSQFMQTNETLNFRILVHGEETRPWAIKFELTTDADIQFFYQCNVSCDNFMHLQMENQLSIDFDRFVGMVKTLLQDCANDPMSYQTSFTMENDDGCAFFRFDHHNAFKKSQILQLVFKQIDDEEI